MKVNISKLSHHPKNQEIYDLSSIEELMESISEVGLLQPLIIDQHQESNRSYDKKVDDQVLVAHESCKYLQRD